MLGSVSGRTDFSRIFIFGPPDFFADLLIFVGRSGQKNPPGKSLAKSSKFYTTKILQHISADWPGQQLPCNYPHREGNFERGKDALSCGGRGSLGANLGEGGCESKIAARQCRVNFYREASRCLARPLWVQTLSQEKHE